MNESSRTGPSSKSSQLDPLVFGRRLRHLRREAGLTLKELGQMVGRGAPYLSQIETGRREPTLTLINSLGAALSVAPAELIQPRPASRRDELEIALYRAQADPLWSETLALPALTPSSRLPTAVLDALVRLFDEAKHRGQVRAETPEGARKANAALRREMRARDNYFPEIESEAASALAAVGYTTGPVTRRVVAELAAHYGFSIHAVADLPESVRSLTDQRQHRIYIPQRNRLGARLAGSVVLQSLGQLVLRHEHPSDFGEFLRQRVEANYFAGAILIPEAIAVPMLEEAKDDRDLGLEEIEERFSVSYEMAAHRFTNLATRHLGIPLHFLRSDDKGVVWKAYENDGIPFPTDPDGAIEGQLLCRKWGPAAAFGSEHKFSLYCQHTETPAGPYWSMTYLETARTPSHAVTIGTTFEHSRYFRGGDTARKVVSGCPDLPCCKRPPAELARRWDGMAWPAPRPHSHVLAALPAGTFPGVDLTEVYEFLERHAH
jgi:predicted transcriptional regulator/DNA-binding XRE family transcriptional regulator